MVIRRCRGPHRQFAQPSSERLETRGQSEAGTSIEPLTSTWLLLEAGDPSAVVAILHLLARCPTAAVGVLQPLCSQLSLLLTPEVLAVA